MKAVIADDHWVVRQSLKQLLKTGGRQIDICEAATFDEAMHCLDAAPDTELVLIDLAMPGFENFAGLEKLRSRFPAIPVVVVSVHDDVHHVMAAMNRGVIGYILKSYTGVEMERALNRVLSGEVSFPRHVLEQSAGSGPVSPQRRANAALPDLGLLTPREREIFARIGKGESVKVIAERLELTDHTVRVHMGRLMKKLKLEDRAKLIHLAVSTASGGAR